MKRSKSTIVSFKEALDAVHRDFTLLFKDKAQAKNARLMQRIALNVQQLYLDAQKLQASKKHHRLAEHILFTITTPWGAPFVQETTLLEAAENFSHQTPKYSDLHRWVSGISRYGHHFPDQILYHLSNLLLSRRSQM